MWNPLHETDSTFVAWRRSRWLCAGALVLAACLFVLGFLFGTGALATHSPEPTRLFAGSRGSRASCRVGPAAGLRVSRGVGGGDRVGGTWGRAPAR